MSHDPDLPPVSSDRPFVDGTERSSEDLRAEVAERSDPAQADAEASVRAVRAELGATVTELAGRLDVPARARHRAARMRDDATDAARAHAGQIGVGVTAAVLALLIRRVRRRSSAPDRPA